MRKTVNRDICYVALLRRRERQVNGAVLVELLVPVEERALQVGAKVIAIAHGNAVLLPRLMQTRARRMLQAVTPWFAEKENPVRQRRDWRAIEDPLAVRSETAESHAHGERYK